MNLPISRPSSTVEKSALPQTLTQPLPEPVRQWVATRFIGETADLFHGVPAVTASDRAKIGRWRQNVEWALTPAERPAIIITLTRLAAHFWGDRGPAEWKIVFEDYADDLAEFPPDIIGDGIVQYRRQAKWWPKVSELIELMRPKLLERRMQLARLKVLEKIKPADETDREAGRRKLHEKLGAAHDDYVNIPWQRRYSGTLEEFLKGWNLAFDKAAFCESWGQN